MGAAIGSGPGKPVFTKFNREDNYTILLLRQTGSGKTSLMNLIANFKTVLKVLFDEQVVLSTPELVEFGLAHLQDLDVEHAMENGMASKTSQPRVYQLELATNWHFTIMDTPGYRG